MADSIITDSPFAALKGSAQSGTTGEDTSRSGGADGELPAEKSEHREQLVGLRRRGKAGKLLLIEADEPQDGEEEEQGREESNKRPALEREASMGSLDAAGKKKWRLFMFVPYEELPDVPYRNILGMTMQHPVRKKAVALALNRYLEGFWLFLGLVHFLVAMPEIQGSVFGCVVTRGASTTRQCKYTLPDWHHFIFLFLFFCEAIIKIIGLGFSGGKFAWWTHEFYNKLDIIALLAYVYEVLAIQSFGSTSSFTLRGFRIVRLLQPLSQIGIFSDLETIFHAIGAALIPMATVLLFIWFVLILFGIMGIALWGGASFRRRCVWADTFEIKAPEQWCKRNELWRQYPDCNTIFNNETYCAPYDISTRQGALAGEERMAAGLDSTCGPFQLCLDVANPNSGFTSFDHLPGALLTLFQVMSGDNDVLVMWYSIQSEPERRLMAEVYYLLYTFLVIHVLINVFVAVFANIFAETRAEHEEMIEMRRKGMKRLTNSSGSSSGSSVGSSYESSSSGGTLPSEQVEIAEVNKSPEDGEDAVALAISRQFKMKATMDKRNEDEREKVMRETGEWIKQLMETKANPSLMVVMQYFFRDNDFYDGICFTTIVAQSVSLALVGQITICSDGTCSTDRVDELCEQIIENLNYFFIFDTLIQIVCDGSLAQHFASGESIFNFMITIFTTVGLVLRMMGVSQESISALRGFAILRLLRIFKFNQTLNPIWLMLIKCAGSLMSVMNLVLFNTLFAIIYFSIGRSMLQERLSSNDKQNYSSLSRGYMLLLAVMTGDGWSGNMYEAMATFCTGDQSEDTCDNVYVVLTALFYMIWFFYGGFLFLTMFLAIILEAFSVEEFMEKAETEDEIKYLDKDETIKAIAEFQNVPEWHVHKGLVKLAFLRLSDGSPKIAEPKLMTLVRMVQPMTKWRYMKTSGFVMFRWYLRNSVCMCFANSWLKPFPGDEDYVRDDGPVVIRKKTNEEAELEVAQRMGRQIKEYMKKLKEGGMLGEVLIAAKMNGVLEHLDVKNIEDTEAFIALKILRQESIAKRLHLGYFFESLIEDVMNDTQGQKRANVLDSQDEFAGLDLSKLDESQLKIDLREDAVSKFRKQFRTGCFKLVHNDGFNFLMFSTIVVSSVFLCVETPHPSMPGVVSSGVLFFADFVFNGIFMVELIVKSTAFGFYTPINENYMSYLQVTQNRIDLFVLSMAIAEMTGAGEYVGKSTTKAIRMMKVMRPVRLLLRSEGLKAIIDALIASLKPMAYATLFLGIVCLVFAVLGMALFRKKTSICNDLALDGTRNEGIRECVGPYLNLETGYLEPRTWEPPKYNFDTLASATVVLFRILTLNWVGYFLVTQDSVAVDVQPVMGFSMTVASLYFHAFLLVGSFFGLNLFASFMCDTFYSLQGTAQLEEVQWMAVKQMLKSHQPKKNRTPPKNVISTALRQLLHSVFWQNFSAFCLLLNVTFMGTEHSSQDASFDLFLDEQNTIFFGVMCAEAGLHLISVGPILYLLNPGHQFDIFLISATSATMIFADSLRSLSQVTRILRLFKFLRALAKDRTIANVFETVLVSMGQVVNILIVLVVLLVMLSVLAVQMFGTVRPGWRLGISANFSSFGDAFHLIFQLMFGEDMPTLWDDCALKPPYCTPDFTDVHGKLMVSDCPTNSYVADLFFPAVLVLTNYVMLNLFVGMIMNNFAYISCKDGNGAVEDEHFIDAAFKYVERLDPNLNCQIPLEKVYQFYHMIGKPLGDYDTTKNYGRYLCVREELRRQMNEPEEVQHSWFYKNVYVWIVETEETLTEVRVDEWKRIREALHVCEQEYKDVASQLENEREYVRAMKRVGLEHLLTDSNQDEKEDVPLTLGMRWVDVGSEKPQVGVEIHNRALAAALMSRTEFTLEEFDTFQVINLSESSYIRADERYFRPTINKAENVIPEGDKAKPAEAADTVGGIADSLGDEDGHVMGHSFGSRTSITVHGGNMGAKQGPAPRVKMVKKQSTKKSLNAIEDQLADHHQKANPLFEQQKILDRLQVLEEKLENAKKAHAAEGFEPKPTLQMRFYALIRFLSSFFLSEMEKNARKPGHVRYSEIILALLYWNKERNIVPQKMVEQRHEKDQEIQFEVAFQMIRAVCAGGIVRRQKHLAKLEAKKRLMRAGKLATGGVNLAAASSRDKVIRKRREALAPMQDENATEKNLWIYTESLDTGPLKLMLCKIAKYELATGRQLAKFAYDQHFEVGPQGIFDLEEVELQQCLTHSADFKKLKMHCEAIDEIKSFMQEVSELAQSYLKLAAAKHGIDIGEHFENLMTVKLEELQQLLGDPYVRTILPSAIHAERIKEIQQERGEESETAIDHASAEELWKAEMELRRQKEEAEIRQQLADLKEQYHKQEARFEELNRVLEYTRQRQSTMEEDLEKRREQNMRQARQAAAVKNAVKSVRRVASLTSESRVQSNTNQKANVLQVWSEEEENSEDDEMKSMTLESWFDKRDSANAQADIDQVQRVHIAPDHDGLAQSSRYDASASKGLMRPNTAPVAGTALPGQHDGDWFTAAEEDDPSCVRDSQGQVMTPVMPFHAPADEATDVLNHIDYGQMRPFTAPEPRMPESDADRLEATLRIAQAEIERMERIHSAAVREQQQRRKKALQGDTGLSEDQQESIEQARARRQKKNMVIVDSDSTSSGLLSPRDKPMRKDVVRREQEKKQRAAEDRANAGSRGSSRASSRQGSRPASRSINVGITF